MFHVEEVGRSDMSASIVKVANVTLQPSGADIARDHSSMLWVGGRVTLGNGYLMFNANRMNRWITPLMHQGASPTLFDHGVALKARPQLRFHRAFGTSIIEIVLRDGSSIGVRCWGATAFFEQLEAAVAEA